MSQEPSITTTLNVRDLILLEQCIRVCHSRGVFRIEEMMDVSSVYVKLKKIVDEQQAASASSNTSLSANQSNQQKPSRMSVIDE